LIALVSKKGLFIFSTGLTSLAEIHMGWCRHQSHYCFAHVGFKDTNQYAQLTKSTAETPVIDDMSHRPKGNGIPMSNKNFTEYMDIDRELLTCSQPTEDVIVEEKLQGKMVDESDKDASGVQE
jgi:hypothetical protein